MKRVVVTGIGAVTALGNDYESTWSALLAGKSGVQRIPEYLFDASELATQIAAFIPLHEHGGPDIDSYMNAKDQRKADKFIQFAVVAADDAIKDAGWSVDTDEKAESTGVIVGSGIGGLATIAEQAIVLHERGPRRITPFFIPRSLINLASGAISIKHNFKGPNHSVVTACSTGAHAIGDAARLIACGEAKVMIAGGAESAVTKLGMAGFNACHALSTGFNDAPTKASRPWDRARDGFVMGEGAGVVVLEEYEHAKQRGARIYAEIVGYAYTGDAYHITSPSEDGDGAYRAMRNALRRASLSPTEIDYVNAHGTSTPAGDMVELLAMRRLFGDDISNIPISSTKSAVGHLLGAAGSLEAVFSVLAMRDGIMPPTLNLDDPDEGCAGVDLVPHKAKEKRLNVVISNSFGFGGTNVTLVFRNV